MQPLYHARTLIDLNCRQAPWNGTGELPPKILDLPIQANSIVQVTAETGHKPDPHNVWLQINVWIPQLDGSYMPSSGWIRQERHPDPTKPWVLNVAPVLCPPTLFQVLNITTQPITIVEALKIIRDYIEGL